MNPIVKLLFRKILGDVGKKNLETREDWLKKILSKIPEGSTILDAGAGELKYKKFCGHLKYASQDFGQYDGQGDQVGLETGSWNNTKLDIISDITNIPEKDNSFDAIMCIEVFEHLPNPIKAIEEFSRLIKKGGYLIITAPFCSLTHFSPYHFSTGFNKHYYEMHLNNYGFEILEMKRNGNYFEYLAQELRRLSSVAKRYSNIGFAKRSFIKLLLFPLLLILESLSKKNNGSEELLCFGYHILARKK